MYDDLDDNRIIDIKPLTRPQDLMEDIPLSKNSYETIVRTRKDAENIIKGLDDRLIVIVGPCSIHDPNAAIDYAKNLKEYSESCSEDLLIIMRVYFEKPRTITGWKGLINDPHMNNTFKINSGLRIARTLLFNLNDYGIPCGVEFLDTISPQYIGDLVSWGAIGARTTESQVHRELASGLSCPVGFKNGTDGNIQIAVDAIKSAKESHHFLSVTKQGTTAIVKTSGNDSCHIILRGSSKGTNYDKENVSKAYDKNNNKIMIDCSHGNSNKDFKNQKKVVISISEQLKQNSTSICGVMIESNIKEGRQDIKDGENLVYGQSVTDSCIGWEETLELLDMLCEAVKSRRCYSK